MTITKERLLKIQHWRETYGADSNVMLPAEEAAELARIALASLEAEKGADPVVFTDERNLRHIASGRETSLIWGKQNQEVGDIPLYRHAQPVPVDKEFIPKNLDKALGVVGVALPESKEEFNFQIERWIQRLIDRVIRYADEFKEQPMPVVPDEWTIQDAVKFCRETGRQDAGSAMEAWNACRTAMLQGGQPVSNRDELQVIGWLRSDYNSDDKRDPNAPLFMLGSNDPSETWGVKYIPLSGNSPVIPSGWISCSERMPDKLIPVMVMYEDGEMWSAMWNGKRWDDGTEYPDPHSVTHWREMPAAPQQEVK
ncbi:DUF551 domain-containing protein [Salmonella enterica]|uniref:DUF551 domain-containing protein n=1 Tax=Salmonella enterica subsp. enterica serovar Lattenkamp TaxID=2564671 RepID=A0A5W2LZX6_SALET|nr:DUF551 domain-containing protein [Salmonella enterica subsp. enterica serovar Lattenkamp]EAQ8606253.1 DUF551 domain-containing protein [Salmonella enterica]ECJ3925168.1 DUF551 domain-containing protein [Salmonella enterica subsp. enterica]EAR5592763.1 DUF551 domain-containing protein [Salmonella enterica]EAV2734686.1 DUF551 domain-containing protein [Salmonella enterica]